MKTVQIDFYGDGLKETCVPFRLKGGTWLLEVLDQFGGSTRILWLSDVEGKLSERDIRRIKAAAKENPLRD